MKVRLLDTNDIIKEKKRLAKKSQETIAIIEEKAIETYYIVF